MPNATLVCGMNKVNLNVLPIYVLARLNTPWESNGVCTTAQYSLNTTNSRVIVNNTERLKTPQGAYKGAVGEAWAPNPQEPAKLLVRFPQNPISINAPYWVLSTDYDNYATIVTCIEVASVYHTIASWIIARKPALDSKILNDQLTLLKGYGVAVDKFTPTLQQGCW